MKRSSIRKTAKKDTLGYWKKEFWTVFSKFIRSRDSFTCFTCGREGGGKGLHAGHFIPRATGGLSLFFHERNVHAQCYHCNINLGGNGAMYYKKMVERYGQISVDELFELKDQGYMKYCIEDYQHLIEVYKIKVEDLQ